MIRLALPKGRNLEAVRAALLGAGVELTRLDERRLVQRVTATLEVLLLKDWDIPLYVEHGVADCGFVGTDVLEELEPDLLAPLRLVEGRSRMSLIGLTGAVPAAGHQVRVATKYPGWARRLLEPKAWGADLVRLSGSVELGPLLRLADVAVDIVQTGGTIREHGLVEVEELAAIAPTLVVNRGSFQRHRDDLNDLMARLEACGAAES